MKSQRWWAKVGLVAVVLPAVLVFVPTTVARADDCSTPADCSNTAWTVGGAAAAAAAVVAAAAAAGWLNLPEERPGAPRMSRECFIDLQILGGPIKGTIQQIAELTVTLVGAGRMWLDAQNRAAGREYEAAQIVGGSQTFDRTTWTSTMSSGTGEYASGHVAIETRRAAQAGERAQSLGYTAVQVGRAGEPGMAARAAQRAAAYDAEQEAVKAGVGRFAGPVGIGAGVVNVAAEAYGQYTYDSREDALRGAGQKITQAELARMEAQRWKAYMDNLQKRIDGLKPALLEQIRAYNTRAAECNAVPLSENLGAFTRVTLSAASEQPGAGAAETAPESVLSRGPQPLPERDPAYVECDAGFYQKELASYENDIAQLNRRSALFVRWRQREADLEVTLDTAKAIQLGVEDEIGWWLAPYRACGAISGTTAALAITPCFTPLGQLIFGGISLVSGIAESMASPSAWAIILAGRMRARIDWLINQLGYATQEQVRLRDILNQIETNLRARRGSLRASFRACNAAAKGWEPPPDLPDFATMWEAKSGQVRAFEDFGKWP